MVKKLETKEIDLRERVYTFVDLHPEMTSASVLSLKDFQDRPCTIF